LSIAPVQSHFRFLILFLLLPLSGCGAMAASLFGAGAETASSTGVAYTVDNIAYRTFVLTPEPVEQDVLASLEFMGFPVSWTQRKETGLQIHARGTNPAHEVVIEVEVQPLSAKTTRLRVIVKHGTWVRDAATATEIILQTTRKLDTRIKISLPATG
jgi:hypothetical protein